MRVQYREEAALSCGSDFGRAVSVADGIDRGRQSRERGSGDDLSMDRKAGPAGRRDELMNAVEGLPPLPAPLCLERGIERELPAALDVGQKVGSKLARGGSQGGGGRHAEILIDRRLQSIARRGQTLQ